MSASAGSTAYDAVRYPGKFYPQSSPERLATLATLYGLTPAAVAHCRVLELGCGDGGNLIPLAYHFPESRFLGVDLSAGAIERGRSVIAQLGLANIELRALDIAALPSDVGTFDYIISHGVLSWVPEPVRERMLEICAHQLAAHGVVYLSYNTLPGGYVRAFARDLMRLHTDHITDPALKTREARAAIELLLAAMPADRLERELVRRTLVPYEGKDYFLFHDLLAEVHDPVYFLDFMEAAAAHGLQFISESSPASSRTAHLPEAVRRSLAALPDRLQREQYLDFINARRFRQTVLCRSEHKLDLEVTPQRMERLLIACAAKPIQADADVRSSARLEFRRGEAIFGFSQPIPKALFMVLAEHYPKRLRFSQLRECICAKLAMPAAELKLEDDARLVQQLVSSFVNGIVELHVHPFECRREVSARPTASALARIQAEMGVSLVAADLTTFAVPDGLLRTLVSLLDGTRDFEGLLIELYARIGSAEHAGVNPENLRRALELLAARGVLTG
ncbi:MAG: class I SAM-dependent methyltransferase [Steroidobacteraceae bacterium]